MAQTPPIPAGQPPGATRTAAGQIAALAGAQAVAVQATASLTLAALLWPLIPAAHAVAGLASALGQRLPLHLLPEQQRSWSCPDRAAQDGPRRYPAARRGRFTRPT